jgi:hypothetical protein
MEGIQIYVLLIEVFQRGKSLLPFYYIAAYGGYSVLFLVT